MLDIKGAFRVTKVKIIGLNIQYMVLLLGDRLVFVRIGGQSPKSDWSSKDSLQLLNQFRQMSVDELVLSHKSNFQVSYGDFIKIEFEESPIGINGARIGVFSIISQKKKSFDISPGQEFSELLSIVSSVLPDKINVHGEPAITDINPEAVAISGEAGIKTADIVDIVGNVDNMNEHRVRNGANWFFWIAGLSVINFILYVTGSNLNFLIGLGFTQVAAGFASAFGGLAIAVASISSIIIAGFFVVFGTFSRKKKNWAFVSGIVFYTLDALIFLMVQDWLSIAFHIFALIFIVMGAIACFRIKKMRQTVQTS